MGSGKFNGVITKSTVWNDLIREDDSQWPTKNVVGSQEIEIRLGTEHISFEASRCKSFFFYFV